MIKTRNLHFSYDDIKKWNFPDIHLEKGQNLLVSGLSGSGKTSLMHLLAGILKPSKGEIFIDQTNIVQLTGRQLDNFRGRKIGIIFQTPHFIRSLNAIDNLRMAQILPGNPPDESRIKMLLTQLQLTHRSHAMTYELSVGEQQRLSIARALVNHPLVLLADEPTSSLDDKRCNEVISLLEQLSMIGESTLIVISHDSRLKSHFSNQLELKG